ncbi:hypothetical protein M758_6G024200 [Ceratodon purpureus]|uniref:Uncharacterized protein n=1 Tax=Ceratodon purpureus TaxID=3225 RepID=A0A8T0HB89_CERPU|nr:hypothetical protein KC19_N039800 [Ceratodon purpureus]KAG0568540.1 hypothetical protein KC19_6G027000 [Ceratodon purpureus]KAG0612397.1 hypothetical protein M758_6G024200 [Ceratodon purpureus]
MTPKHDQSLNQDEQNQITSSKITKIELTHTNAPSAHPAPPQYSSILSITFHPPRTDTNERKNLRASCRAAPRTPDNLYPLSYLPPRPTRPHHHSSTPTATGTGTPTDHRRARPPPATPHAIAAPTPQQHRLLYSS